MRLTLVAVLALGTVAWSAPPSGLSPVAEELWLEAERLEAAGELARARRVYRNVFEVTDRPEAALEAARLSAEEGDLNGAVALLRQAPPERDVLVALVTLQLRADRHADAARTLRELAGYASEPDVLRLRAMSLAQRDPLAAAELVQDWLGFAVNGPLDPTEAEEVALLVAAALRDEEEHGAAVALLEQVRAAVPEVAEAVADEQERAEVKRLALQLARSGAEPLGQRERKRLAEARAAWEAGETEGAAGMLDAVVVVAPRNPEVRGLRARVLRDLGEPTKAEVELLAAEALDPLDARWPTALGELLSQSYAGRFDDEAVAAWDRALALEPRRPALWLRKARLELSLGSAGSPRWRERARRSLERVVEVQSDGALADEARRMLVGLSLERPEPPDLPAGRACREGVSTAACEHYYLAEARWRRALARTGDEARAELSEALSEAREAAGLAPRWERPINLQAHLLRLRGEGSGEASARDREASERLYRKSLTLEPDQPAIHVHLGKLREREGDRAAARQEWELAVDLAGPGAAAAHLYLAEDALENYRIWEVRGRIHAYRSTGAGTGELDALAEDLRQRVALIETAGLAGVGTVFVAGVGLIGGRIWRRRRGRSVEDLLQRDPSSWREVAGIASALRHEVLKHHTSVLPVVADALEAHETESAAWLAERLVADDGPVARGRRYLEQLRELGRRAGIPLDLARRDAVFGPVVTGLERLEACARPLRRGATRIVPELRAIADLLNEQAYPALGALVQRICVIELDRQIIEESWRSVLGEPAFREVEAPELVIEMASLPVWVRVWRDELCLVLVNLLRNALEASVDGDEVGRIGVRLQVEEDPITLLERVAIRVVDDAPKRVSTAMIRGRYIDRGLGLTVDVISRNAGSIHVEDEPGWAKAVVVRLPTVERAT